MRNYVDCDYCGSAGSVEFNMCQVCLKDYSERADRLGEGPRPTALGYEIDRIIAGKTTGRPPAFIRGSYVA